MRSVTLTIHHSILLFYSNLYNKFLFSFYDNNIQPLPVLVPEYHSSAFDVYSRVFSPQAFTHSLTHSFLKKERKGGIVTSFARVSMYLHVSKVLTLTSFYPATLLYGQLITKSGRPPARPKTLGGSPSYRHSTVIVRGFYL